MDLQGVHKYCVFSKILKNILDSGPGSAGLSRLSLVDSVCTPNFTLGPLDGRSITDRTGRVKKIHNILRKKTQYLEHPVLYEQHTVGSSL